MDKQVVLITGSRQGIGRYLAEYYSLKDFIVIGCSRSQSDYHSENYEHFCINVGEEESVKSMFKEIRKKYKKLDILINNAGVPSVGFVMLTSGKTIENVLKTNTFGTMIVSREACNVMAKNKFGRIINITSLHVPLCFRGTSIYGASKAAIEQFAKVLAREVYTLGITVNNLSLSAVENSGMTDSLSNEIISEIIEKTISNKWLKMEDISHTIDFLVSEKSGMITGHTLYLGGV